MKNSKLSVCVGVPAYNEEHGIKSLITSLLQQKEEGFFLKEILVISDASTDNTVQAARSLHDKRVRIIEGTSRLGKPFRLNQIFSQSRCEIVVILDADIVIPSKNTLRNLIMPFTTNTEVVFASGNAKPLPGTNFVQKVLYHAEAMWDICIKNKPMYQTEGSIRAFKKVLYKKLRFPSKSADDVFPYLYCIKNKFTTSYVRSALVYYQLPFTYKDYLLQASRYLYSEDIQSSTFNTKIINSSYVIKPTHKLKTFITYSLKHPLFMVTYLLFLVGPRFLYFFKINTASSVWIIASSTKKPV